MKTYTIDGPFPDGGYRVYEPKRFGRTMLYFPTMPAVTAWIEAQFTPQPAVAVTVEINHGSAGYIVCSSTSATGPIARNPRVHPTLEDATWDARKRLLGDWE